MAGGEIMELWKHIKRWASLKFCKHDYRIYEPPTLHYHENGNPYVISRSYCGNCRQYVPFPAEHDRDAAAQMLLQAQLKKAT